MVHLGELIRSGEVNQLTYVIQNKLLFILEFSILPNRIKERSDFDTV